ncbi:MAG: TrmH family RNA methyltransferase [Caldilineae bacterium]|nr:MAG: TrmH family RNA methyltransferase [Caldilineae bacterium]
MTPRYCMCTCRSPACRFRFPAEEADPRGQTCPLCGAPTDRQPFPVTSRTRAVAPSRRGDNVHLVLDNLRSSYNVGSLLRTADGAGVAHVHLCGITPRPDHPGVAKTALGAQENTPWTWHPNGLTLIQAMQAGGRRVWALEAQPDAPSLFTLEPPTGPMALVIGNERAGVDPGILEACDQVAALPMAGGKRSLNAASAGAIAIYWLCWRA